MKIYFEDGFLVDTIRLPEKIDFKLDASKGFSHCRSRLDALLDADMCDRVIYTNSLAAADNKFVWNSLNLVPEFYVRDRRHGSFTRIDCLIEEKICETTSLFELLIKYITY